MRARIGIADTGREIEVEVESRDAVAARLEAAYRESVPILWFENAEGRDVGVPLERIAFIELIDDPNRAVGFAR